MDDASRVIWLKRALDRPSNDDTLHVPAVSSSPETEGIEASRTLFRELYARIRKWVNAQKNGVAVVALNEEGIQAKAFIRAHGERVNAAIAGRHDKADVFLAEDPTVSLRHLAMLIAPTRGSGLPRVKLIDLRTGTAFTDIRGTRLRACESDFPFIVRCGHYVLVVAPVGDEPRWPDRPASMWSRLLERNAEGLAVPPPATLDDPLLGEGEEVLGELAIASPHGQTRIVVGRRAVRSGVLLGRSDRCDGEALLRDLHISRVHALIVEVAGQLYAVDAASKNGLWDGGTETRTKLLLSGASFSLCGRATVGWQFYH